MQIPHEAPLESRDLFDTPFPPPCPNKYHTWEDFHPEFEEGQEPNPPHRDNGLFGPHWKHVANKIHRDRTRFAKHNALTSAPDRSAVLAVYHEAHIAIEHASDKESRAIYAEMQAKIKVILDVSPADPDSSMFTTKNAFLKPLEPQYAQPRLDYHDRDTDTKDDPYHYHGFSRLRAWRKEGWPGVYPKKAVEKEMNERARRLKQNRIVLRATASETMLRSYNMDKSEWGDEVDADPERPWK